MEIPPSWLMQLQCKSRKEKGKTRATGGGGGDEVTTEQVIYITYFISVGKK
jgi:hypothetical protein